MHGENAILMIGLCGISLRCEGLRVLRGRYLQLVPGRSAVCRRQQGDELRRPLHDRYGLSVCRHWPGLHARLPNVHSQRVLCQYQREDEFP